MNACVALTLYVYVYVCGEGRTVYSPLLPVGVAVAKQTTFIWNKCLRPQQQNKIIFGHMHTMGTSLVREGRKGKEGRGQQRGKDEGTDAGEEYWVAS